MTLVFMGIDGLIVSQWPHYLSSILSFVSATNWILFIQEITFPKMVANCCRFLCYFCRISRQNQKAMFDHLSYLLENSSVGLGKLMYDINLIFTEKINCIGVGELAWWLRALTCWSCRGLVLCSYNPC